MLNLNDFFLAKIFGENRRLFLYLQLSTCCPTCTGVQTDPRLNMCFFFKKSKPTNSSWSYSLTRVTSSIRTEQLFLKAANQTSYMKKRKWGTPCWCLFVWLWFVFIYRTAGCTLEGFSPEQQRLCRSIDGHFKEKPAKSPLPDW